MGFLSDLVDSFTGAGDRDAARDATQAQIDAEREAREQLVELNAPFVELGTRALPGLDPFINDPSGASFLEGNPMFDAAIDRIFEDQTNLAAAQGRSQSGGLVDELFKSYLATGDSFVNSAFQRAVVPVEIGQNAANFQGTNVANSLTNEGAIRGAGAIATQNARNRGLDNITGLAQRIFGF